MTPVANAWVHPGIVVSDPQLQAVRAAYLANNSVIVDQVNKAESSAYGSSSYTVQGPWPGGINQCGASSNPNNGCSEADNDSNAAYVQALLWYITGNQTYANNAIAIMNAYARNFKGYARGVTACPARAAPIAPMRHCSPAGMPRSGRGRRKSFATRPPVVVRARDGRLRISPRFRTCWCVSTSR